jgi:hypothetical protein
VKEINILFNKNNNNNNKDYNEIKGESIKKKVIK